MKKDVLRQRVSDVLTENDPARRLALSRKLRAEVGDLLGEYERKRLSNAGFDADVLCTPLRRVE